ncbi:hypothetical protein BsWGS_00853 [Bradybaena similaris]
MTPKPRKKDVAEALRKEETIVEVVEQVPDKVLDPYIDLRFTAQLPSILSRSPTVGYKQVAVIRKKKVVPPSGVPASAYQPPTKDISKTSSKPKMSPRSDINMPPGASKLFPRDKDEINPNMINIGAVNSKPLSKWFAPAELPRTPQPIEVLRRASQESSAYSCMIERSYLKEFEMLRRFDQVKLKEFQMENYIMKNTGKTRQGLLLRKKQFLPHIDRDGEETTHDQFERTETPEIIYDTDMFSEAARTIVEKNGIRRTLTRREKGYNVVTDWIGCPEVTDFIAEILGKPSGANYDIYHQCEETEPAEHSDNFVPEFEKLAVIGLTYEKVQQQLKDIAAARVKREEIKPPLVVESHKPRYGAKKDSFNVNLIGAESTSSFGEPTAGLAIGQIMLFWTQDARRSEKKWVIELGCTAEMGKDSIGSISMKNIGTTAVHFKWRKIPAKNTFKLKRFELRRFVFDCWGGVILPGETFRVPVLYKCIEPGFYSEDWQLLTEPVMENGAVIITRLWGITRQYDPYRRIREDIDSKLENRIGITVVEHRIQKLIDYLPVKEVPLKDTRFPLIHLGPDLFHLNNPTLKYHFASVYRLGKLAAMTENKRTISTYRPEKSTISVMFSDNDEYASEAITASKVEYVDEEDVALNEHGMYSDGTSFYSEEESPNSILYIKRQIEEQINPDIPISDFDIQDYVEDEADYEEDSTKRKRPLAINLINPDFYVDTIRQNILENVVDPQDHREAQFLILSEQVTRLLFSTDMPIDTWKLVVARGLLCSIIDTFSEFATSLKEICCEAQLISSPKEARTSASTDASAGTTATAATAAAAAEEDKEVGEEEEVEDEIGLGSEEHSSEETITMCDVKSEIVLSCSESHPRRGLQFQRYQDQYFARLYCQMYSLLSDYLDSFHDLLTEPRTLQIVQEDIGFTRVREIPMHFRLEDILNAPLPPGWVMLAQRMDNTVYRNQARKKALNDGLTC